MNTKLEPIIGLEIHVQLKTKSKMFCSCSNVADDIKPNSVVCPICMGHPGTLPTLNESAVDLGVKLALALNLKINQKSVFERKNYFYPDLPQGYQITQLDEPLSRDGFLIIKDGDKKVRVEIEKLHIENDSAKNLHKDNHSLIDFNRAGTPLAEIVTRPSIKSAEAARIFLQDLRQICRYLGVSDADMEKGNLRCDVNVSLRPVGDDNLYPKTEVKNLNSFRSVEGAIKYEIERQSISWNNNKIPREQTTRGWDENKQITVLQRSKEEANDYRYFKEPDLKALIISDEKIEKIKSDMIELPYQKLERFVSQYELDIKSAEALIVSKNVADYFEAVISEFREWILELGDKRDWKLIKKDCVRIISGWICSEIFKLVNQSGTTFENMKISAENMGQMIAMLYENQINSSAGQLILKQMFETGVDPLQFAKEQDLLQESDEGILESLVNKIILDNEEQVSQYKSGKENLMKYFVGVAMKETRGRANPVMVEKLFKDKLS